MPSVILDVPFPYTMIGTTCRQRHYRIRRFLGRVAVEVPVLDSLPAPAYSVGIDGPDRVDWHRMVEGLLRPVLHEGLPAFLQDIEDARELLPYPGRYREEHSWFADHPSAAAPLPQYKFDESHARLEVAIEGYRVRDSDRDDSAAACRRLYAKCVVHEGMLLAPAQPPTWRVMMLGRNRAAVDVAIIRSDDLAERPDFHFGIRHLGCALEFARHLTEGGEIATNPVLCGWDDGDQGRETDGALATARWLMQWLLKKNVRRRLSRLDRNQVAGLAALRNLFEGPATDERADQALMIIERARWNVDDKLPLPLGQLLALRRELIARQVSPPDLRDMVI